MAFGGPLILKGNLKIDTVSPPVKDVSEQVLAFKIMGERDMVTIPATLATPKVTRAGGTLYSVEISFLSNDTSATDDLFRVFWSALSTADGTLYGAGTMRDGVIAATNPEWQFQFIVSGAALGGDAEGLSSDTRTFPLTAAPVIDITP